MKLAARTMRRRGLSAAEIDHATRMAAYFASGADSAATDHVLRLTGHAPRSIEALLAEHASAFSPTTRLARALSRPHEGTSDMVTRIGHIALHVADLDAAVEFQQQVIGMVETERVAGASYLTCNERHHELILIEDRTNRGYEHLALEVPTQACSTARQRLTAAGGTLLGGVYDGEPGIDRALKVRSPGGHVYKLFCGMEATAPPPPGDRPVKFEHISCKVANHRAEERFLTDGLGFRFSDRMGFLASWWHCETTTTASPSPARTAPSSPTTPTNGATSPPSAASPTASRPRAGASASGAPAATAPATTTSSTSTTRTAR